MRKHIGRPVEFEASKREKFCTLVGVGVTRRHAAVSVGVAPSTVTRHMQDDPLFAEQVRDAEMECEVHLMSRIRLQSERSWRAAVWLLERMHPERYARGKAAPSAPSWDEMFDKFVALIDSEVADPSLRERLTQRLDDMALEELAAEEMDGLAPFTVPSAMPTRDATPQSASRPAGNGQRTQGLADRNVCPTASTPGGKNQPAIQNGQKKAGKGLPARSTDAAVRPASQIGHLVGKSVPNSSQDRRAIDFCNTSPDMYETRLLNDIAGASAAGS